MTTKDRGAPTSARRTGRRWMRSLTVLFSTLALVLGLAPAAQAQNLQVSGAASFSHDRFDFTQAINTGGSNFVPGGTVQVDNTVKFNGNIAYRWSNIRRWGVITDPTGFGYQSHTGQSLTNTRAAGSFVGGDLTDTRIDNGETRGYQLKMRIPVNAMGGQRFDLGLQAEVTNDWNVINYPNRIWFVLPAVETTVTNLTVSPNPGRPGEPVTVSARVNARYGTNTPTGTVRFTVEGQNYTANVVNGVATTQITRPTAGTKAITATFQPQNTAQWRTSTTSGSYSLDTETTATNLTLESVEVTAGGTIEAAAVVTPSTAPGTVEFTVVSGTGDPVGQPVTVPVSGGRAEASIPVEAAGSYTVNARFTPTDPQRYSESSDSETVSASAEATTTTVTVDPAEALVGQDVTITAAVSPAGAAGTMTFEVDGATETVDVVNGEASITRRFDANADYPVTATFTPTNPDRYSGSSGTGTVAVGLQDTATELTLDTPTVTAGGTVTASAQVTPAGAAGEVTFTVDGQTKTVAVDSQGRASAQFQLDRSGSYLVEAHFAPTNTEQYRPSSDTAGVSVEVEETQTSVVVAPTVARVGEPTTLTATVTPAGAAGTVRFTVDGEEHTATVTGGTATATHTFTRTGEHPVVATFTPTDPQRYGTSEGTATATVESEATQTSLSLSSVEMTAGGTLTATAQVTPAGAPGDVVFTVDGQEKTVGVDAQGNASTTFQLDAAGTYTVVATFVPRNPERYTTSTDSEQVSVETEGTTTSVSVAPTVARVGEPTTLTATVAPAGAAGTVVFTVDGEEHTAQVVNGVATATHTFDATGSYPVTAAFTPADPERYAPSTGQATATVESEATQTSLSLSSVEMTAGGTLTATAAVTPAAAVGTVVFTVDGQTKRVAKPAGQAQVQAEFQLDAAGTYTVVATFEPENAQRYTTSTDSETVSVDTEGTTTAVTVSPTVARAGEPTTLTATVTPAGAAGTVVFTVAGQALSPVEVTNGVATATHVFDAVGEYPVTAAFTPADPDRYAPSTGQATATVESEATQTDVTVTPTRVVAGQSVEFTATVTPATATGTVAFTLDGVTKSVPVSGGTAVATFAVATAGEKTVTAVFTPTNPERYTSSQDTATFNSISDPTTTELTVSPVSARAGEEVVLTARVGPENVAGTVTFVIDGQTTEVEVVNGVATHRHSFATTGEHIVRAEFTPEDTTAYSPSSDTATVAVASEATTTQVTVDPVRAVAGEQVTVTARVTPAGAAGSVAFDFGDGTAPVSATVTNGVATATHTFARAGDYEISGAFTPANPQRYTASSDTTNVFVTPEPIEQAATTVTIEPVTGAVAGRPVDITATVGPEGVAGEVRFTIDGRTMVAPVVDGVATVTHTFATAGDHPVRAEFVPADRQAHATSVDTATITVAEAPAGPEEPEGPTPTGSIGSITDTIFWLPGTQGTLGLFSGSLGSSGSSLPSLSSIGG